MRYPSVLVSTLVLFVLAGCSGRSPETGPGNQRQANLLTTEEIRQAQPGQNAFDAIRALRPNWLQPRGAQTLGSPVQTEQPGVRGMTRGEVPIMVYVDGTRAGTTDILRQILASDVLRMQFLGGTEAAARFGTDHSRGAILVTTRRGD
jgi:hypothetical protein